jgi:hypothetical protein
MFGALGDGPAYQLGTSSGSSQQNIAHINVQQRLLDVNAANAPTDTYFTDRYMNEWGDAINFDGEDAGRVLPGAARGFPWGALAGSAGVRFSSAWLPAGTRRHAQTMVAPRQNRGLMTMETPRTHPRMPRNPLELSASLIPGAMVRRGIEPPEKAM